MNVNNNADRVVLPLPVQLQQLLWLSLGPVLPPQLQHTWPPSCINVHSTALYYTQCIKYSVLTSRANTPITGQPMECGELTYDRIYCSASHTNCATRIYSFYSTIMIIYNFMPQILLFHYLYYSFLIPIYLEYFKSLFVFRLISPNSFLTNNHKGS